MNEVVSTKMLVTYSVSKYKFTNVIPFACLCVVIAIHFEMFDLSNH